MADRLALLGGGKIANKDYTRHSTMIGREEKRLVNEVLDAGILSDFVARSGDKFLGGEKVRELEALFCDTFGVKYSVSFNSATSALHAAVAAAGVGPGDEVITSPFTMCASASCVIMQNGVPVFADIDPEIYSSTATAIEEKITPRTRAVIAVNIFGHPADLDSIASICRDRRLILIEDNAQAPLATCNGRLTGTIGDIGVFSLNAHKAIQCGEGGIAVTDCEDLATRLRLVRNHGEAVVGDMGFEEIDNTLGWNYRLTELQAAVALAQVPKLPKLTTIRKELAGYLTRMLGDFDFIEPAAVRDGCEHVFYLYPMKIHEARLEISRDIFAAALRAEGFPVNTGYVKPIYLEPMYQQRIAYGRKGCPFSCPLSSQRPVYKKGDCPVAEEMYEERLLVHKLCVYPNEKEDMDLFVAAISKIMANIDDLKSYSQRI